jgi:hypothetical protein
MIKSIVALAGLLSTLVVPAAALSATISALTPDPKIGVGESTQVNVRISGLGDFTGPSLGGFDLTVTYDDSVVSLAGVDFSTWLGDSLKLNTPAADSVDLFEVSVESPSFLNSLQPDAFLLATLYFDGVAQGRSDIGITNSLGLDFALTDADGFLISVDDLNPGSITVVPLPAAAWLFGSAVIGMAGIGWRKRAA